MNMRSSAQYDVAGALERAEIQFKRSGGRLRIKAAWRGGNGWNVAIHPDGGCWTDHGNNGESGNWHMLCDRLGIERPVVYGNSFGGMVAMSYAKQFPEHPAKLILSSTAARMHIDTTVALMLERGGERAGAVARRFWTQPDEQAMQEYLSVCLPLYNPKPNPEEASARSRTILKPQVTRHFVLGEMRTMDARAGLERIVCPTLILAGGYDPITPAVCSQEILDALAPGIGEMHVFPQAGHGVHRDEPAGAERVMRQFLTGPAARMRPQPQGI